MTSEEKIAYVEKQMKACDEGRTNVITCPYCQAKNRASNHALCCKLFAQASMAIIQRWGQQALIDDANRIADKVAQN